MLVGRAAVVVICNPAFEGESDRDFAPARVSSGVRMINLAKSRRVAGKWRRWLEGANMSVEDGNHQTPAPVVATTARHCQVPLGTSNIGVLRF